MALWLYFQETHPALAGGAHYTTEDAMSKNAVTLTGQLIEVILKKDTHCHACGKELLKWDIALRFASHTSSKKSAHRFCLTCKPNRTGFPRDAGVRPGHRNRLRKAAMRSKVKAELSRQTTDRP